MIVKEKIGGLFFDLIKGDTLIENVHIKDKSWPYVYISSVCCPCI